MVHEDELPPMPAVSRSVSGAAGWITLPLKLPMTMDYSFRQSQGSYESGWLVVA
jgi:hypothetical protein